LLSATRPLPSRFRQTSILPGWKLFPQLSSSRTVKLCHSKLKPASRTLPCKWRQPFPIGFQTGRSVNTGACSNPVSSWTSLGRSAGVATATMCRFEPREQMLLGVAGVTGVRSQESGVRSQESGVRSQESGDSGREYWASSQALGSGFFDENESFSYAATPELLPSASTASDRQLFASDRKLIRSVLAKIDFHES
jgi:hypothetical protein